jgi:hypothetical protein
LFIPFCQLLYSDHVRFLNLLSLLSKKYSPEELNKDYSIFRGALEESHPGIYWYTPKNEMDNYFEWGKSQLKDSLNEEDFRKVLAYVISKINCGHTVTRSSKDFVKYRDTSTNKIFPLSLKIWPGTTCCGRYSHCCC